MNRFSFDQPSPGEDGLRGNATPSVPGDHGERATPWVGVHVLSEYLFCPRAGLLALESGTDNGEEEPPLGPRLDYVPDYELHEILLALRAAGSQLRRWLMLLAPACGLAFTLWRLVSPTAGLLASAPILYLLARLRQTFSTIVCLVRRKMAAEAASAVTLDFPASDIQNVNWWSLRKAGFDCIKPQDSFRDPQFRLTGKPWRILVRGGVRIPVIRKHRGSGSWGRQHLARVAAYCHLIETCEGAQAPCGILLFAGSYDCVVIPNNALAQRHFQRGLAQVRQFLGVNAHGQFVPTAPTDSRCAGCHQGCPRRHIAGVTDTVLNGEPLEPFGTRARNWQMYHSPCGDRFAWVPPHDKALSLGISERR